MTNEPRETDSVSSDERDRPWRVQYRVTYWQEQLTAPQREVFGSSGAARRHARNLAKFSPSGPGGRVLVVEIEERVVTAWALTRRTKLDLDDSDGAQRSPSLQRPHEPQFIEENIMMRPMPTDAYSRMIEADLAAGVDPFDHDTSSEPPPPPRGPVRFPPPDWHGDDKVTPEDRS